jgi:polyisoprenoid-binding protein YceI
MKKTVLIIIITVLAVTHLSAQKRYNADQAATKIIWTGKKISKEHVGTIALKEGWITVTRDRITGGEFIVDMTTIRDNDLKDDRMRNMLETHLKSADFFGVEEYPVSRLVLTGSSRFINGTAAVKGNMTIKSSTHPVEFTVRESVSGDIITYTALINVDRSLYNVRYGSGSFFSNLGDNAISDEFTLDVTLVVK